MKSVYRFFLLISGLFLITEISFSQKDPIKWGKLSENDINLKFCPYDSSANAIVLCDYGTISYTSGRNVSFTRHTRIKILSTNGFDEADINLNYYSMNNLSYIKNIKAQTINIENNEPVISEIEDKSYYYTKIDDEFSKVSFTFPSIKVGSIIEYSYTYSTQSFVFLRDWFFQKNIPVLHSEIRAIINENLEYNVYYQGNRLSKKYTNEPTNIWFLDNLPALKNEPYCSNPQDYSEKMSFQLSSYKTLTGTVVNQDVEYVEYMNTPDKVTKTFLNSAKISEFLTHEMIINKILEEIGINKTMTDEEKYKKIHSYMTTYFSWNSEYGIFPEPDFMTLIEKKSGNAASINYVFHMLLEKANINSKLLFISTCNNGMINDIFLNAGQFNHVVNLTYINDKQLFTDASCSVCPPNLLPPNDLNSRGLDMNGNWIPIPIPENNIQNSISVISFAENETIYKNETSYSGISAQEERKLLSFNNEEEYFKKIKNPDPATFENIGFEIINLKNLNEKLIVKSSYHTLDSNLESDYLSIDLFPFEEFKHEVFIEKTRQLPIDFIYPVEKNFYINLTIPKEYEIIGKPEQKTFILPEKVAYFQYKISVSDNNIQIQAKYVLTRTYYRAGEYEILKMFYTLISQKCNEKLFLKKIKTD
jgi:hypothetical protein